MSVAHRFAWALLSSVVATASAHAALTTVYVKSGSYVIPPGVARANLLIRLQDPKGSVILNAGSALRDSNVKCDALGRTAPAIVVAGDDALLESVELLGGCDSDGVKAQGVAGFRFWQGKISTPKGIGVLLAQAANAELFGVWVANARGDGIVLRASSGVQMVATLVYVSPGQRGFVLDAASHANQVVRSRARYNGGVMRADAPDNLFHHSVCETAIGYAACLGGSAGPQDHGNPADFTPRWRTACGGDSFQGSACDHPTPQAALAASAAGERVVADTNRTTGWGDVSIATDGIVLLGNELTMKGAYSYIDYLDDLTVAAPGVHVQNFVVRGAIAVEADTLLTAVD